MKGFLTYTLLAYMALTVQALFFEETKPDLVLILVCFYALRHDIRKGILYGVFAGLIIDVASGFIIGPNIISKVVAVFLIRLARENIYNWNILASTVVIAALSGLDILIVSTCLKTFTDLSFNNSPWELFVEGSLYTVIAAAILYVVIKPDSGEIAPVEQD